MIPLSIPNLAGHEWQYVKACLDTGWVSSVGQYVADFEAAVAQWVGRRHAVATSNGTAALHVSLLLAGVQPGEYVISQTLTFVATINSIAYAGATPILIDADPDTWQMDLALLAHFLDTETDRRPTGLYRRADGRRIAALLPVHVLGNMGDMARMAALAAAYGLPVIEDATEALGSTQGGRQAGSLGLMGAFSFNGNKIITTGGGGMIVTDDANMAHRAKHLTTQAKSDPVEYIHDEVGYNYRLVNVLAALGLAQMEQLPGFLVRKRQVAAHYRAELAGVADVQFQAALPQTVPNEWLFTLRTAHQPRLLAGLQAQGIQVRPLWRPMHQLPMYAAAPYVHAGDVSAKLYQTCLSLPCSTGISDAEVETVVAAVRALLSKPTP